MNKEEVQSFLDTELEGSQLYKNHVTAERCIWILYTLDGVETLLQLYTGGNYSNDFEEYEFYTLEELNAAKREVGLLF